MKKIIYLFFYQQFAHEETERNFHNTIRLITYKVTFMFEISHMRSNLQTPEKFNLPLLRPQARTSLLCSGNARISSFIVRLVINFSLSAQASGIKPEPADTHRTHTVLISSSRMREAH